MKILRLKNDDFALSGKPLKASTSEGLYGSLRFRSVEHV